MEEEQAWKCPKHTSKRRRSGVCPVCLRQRLAALCPDCATARPCSCFISGGAVGRVSSLIDSEPAFRRSRSLAVPFLRSTSSIWSLFKTRNSKCSGGVEEEVIDLRRTAALKKSSSVAEKESKSRGWHFPSPIKMFRSPMYRG